MMGWGMKRMAALAVAALMSCALLALVAAPGGATVKSSISLEAPAGGPPPFFGYLKGPPECKAKRAVTIHASVPTKSIVGIEKTNSEGKYFSEEQLTDANNFRATVAAKGDCPAVHSKLFVRQ